MGLFRYTWHTFGRELLLLLFAVLFSLPLYLLVTISFKTTSAAYLYPLRFPVHPQVGNYPTSWVNGGTRGLGDAILQTSELALGSAGGAVIIGGLCAYALARRPSKLTTGLYLLFLLEIGRASC